MDRNLITAFAFLFAAILFFNSDFYNYRLLNKPKPSPERIRQVQDSLRAEREKDEKARLAEKIEREKQAVSQAGAVPPSQDTVYKVAERPPEVRHRTVTVVGESYIGSLSELGAVATAWRMRGYRNPDSSEINLIPDSSGGALNLTVGNRKLDYKVFSCSAPDTVYVKGQATVSFILEEGEGRVEKRFIFNEKTYDFDLIIRADGMNGREYVLGWKAGILESEAGVDAKWADKSVDVFFGDDVDNPVDKDESQKDVEGFIRWVSLKSKYFIGAMVPREPGDLKIRFKKNINTKASNNPLNYSIEIVSKFDKEEERYKIILGPKKYAVLKSFGIKLEKTLFKGYSWFFKADVWFPPLCGLTLLILNYFYSLIPNYGVAIIFLTILSKIVTYPLTIKSTQSMARMKLLQPKMNEIRARYKSDPMAMNKAIMAMYREEGVSPLGAGGCLPMILQMPIFIALFITLRKAIELRGAPFMLWIQDLSGAEVMFTLPFKIPFYGTNVSLLTLIMAVSMYFQSKQTMTDPKQKAMIYMMPVMMLFMFNSMPSGLILYWALSNILTIGQNALLKPDPAKLAAKPKKKPFFKKPSYNEMLRRMGKR